MTLLELYDQRCQHYREKNMGALIAMLHEHAALLSTNTTVFETQEAYEADDIKMLLPWAIMDGIIFYRGSSYRCS